MQGVRFRQFILKLEKIWQVRTWQKRILTSMLATTVVDAYLVAKSHEVVAEEQLDDDHRLPKLRARGARAACTDAPPPRSTRRARARVPGG